MLDPLLENPRALVAGVARALGGTALEQSQLSGFLSSDFDAFFNHVFVGRGISAFQAAQSLDGKPGFVWLDQEPDRDELAALARDDLMPVVMRGMTASTATTGAAASPPGEISEVRSRAELDAWHRIYCEVLGVDPRSREDWQQAHDALGPDGDGSLLLLLAHADGSAAATGGVHFDQDTAGLYCFATREQMRGRGLASGLVHAGHAAARARGVERALLQATPMGVSVYARAGYRVERPLPVLARKTATG